MVLLLVNVPPLIFKLFFCEHVFISDYEVETHTLFSISLSHPSYCMLLHGALTDACIYLKVQRLHPQVFVI
jgi:hypothetical protein